MKGGEDNADTLRVAALLCLLIGQASPALSRGQSPSDESLAVVHLEAPYLSRAALMAYRHGTIEVALEINQSGEVAAAHAGGPPVIRRELEANVRTWKFADLPAGAKFPITYTIRFEFDLERARRGHGYPCPSITLDLPNRVRVEGYIESAYRQTWIRRFWKPWEWFQ